ADSGAGKQCMRLLRLAVDELGAELDRNVQAWHAARPGASASALARLQDEDAAAGTEQHVGRREAGRAGADHDDVERFRRRRSQGMKMRRQVSASSVAEIGWVKNTLTSPALIESARRNWVSASGPRMRPITAGPTGMSQRRMAKPRSPNTYRV